MATIGEVIKHLRKQRGWTQPQLARKSKIAEVTIARLECGMRTNLRVSMLKQLAKALKVPPAKLLE
jgi:transcriptional regulator with XRE-family HTH domain